MYFAFHPLSPPVGASQETFLGQSQIENLQNYKILPRQQYFSFIDQTGEI